MFQSYHKTKMIIHAGYKKIGPMKSKGAFYELREIAIKENVTMESVTAFRTSPKDEWTAFLIPQAVKGYQDKALLA